MLLCAATPQYLAPTAAPLLTAAHAPAPPQVDDRLNGDGAGIALGVNEPVVGAHLLGVFTTIWALYWSALRRPRPAARALSC